MALIWLRTYPTYEVLGLFFNLHKSNVCRNLKPMLVLLEAQAQFELVWPRADQEPKSLEQVLASFPDMEAILDATEQRIQRPKEGQRPYHSGRKKAQVVKTQIVVNKGGRVGPLSDSVPGSKHDLTLARESAVLDEPPPEVAVTADSGYQCLEKDDPERRIELPFRRSRGHPLTEEEKAIGRELSRRRIVVEHALARMKRFQVLAQVYRHALEIYNSIFRIIAGLANRLQRQRTLAQTA